MAGLAKTTDSMSGKKKSLGIREDGTEKSTGFFGKIKRPDGDVSTELSIGVQIDGKEVLIPSLVPTLTKGEVNQLMTSKGLPPKNIVRKATAHAVKRLKDGRSPFWEEGDPVTTRPSQQQKDNTTDQKPNPYRYKNIVDKALLLIGGDIQKDIAAVRTKAASKTAAQRGFPKRPKLTPAQKFDLKQRRGPGTSKNYR